MKRTLCIIFVACSVCCLTESSLLSLARKYGARVPDGTADNDACGSHKTAYWGVINVGSPPRPFNVLFDTGSSTMILPSAACQAEGCAGHSKFSPPDSKSSHQFGINGSYSADLVFGIGDVAGNFYSDRVCIGNSSKCAVVQFVAATNESTDPWSSAPFDGVFGLSLSVSPLGHSFDVTAAHLLPQGEFSIFLSDKDGDSRITFGGFRPALLESSVLWTSVQSEFGWQIKIDDIALDGWPTSLCSASKGGAAGCQAAVDSGASVLSGPASLIQALTRSINASTDCGNYQNLPSIGFQIGEVIMNLGPEDYIDKTVAGCKFLPTALDVPPPRGPLLILGYPFLRRFVTIYDRSAMKVGFAAAKRVHHHDSNRIPPISLSGGMDWAAPPLPVVSSAALTDIPLQAGCLNSNKLAEIQSNIVMPLSKGVLGKRLRRRFRGHIRNP